MNSEITNIRWSSDHGYLAKKKITFEFKMVENISVLFITVYMNAKLQIPQKHMYFYELKKYDVETR